MSRRKRTKNVQTQGLQEILAELQENVSREAVGGILLVAGGYFLFTLFGPAGLGAPWLAAMLGWTALPTALVLILVGLVLIFGERAGYWSAEALVGAELLLMVLAVATFVWQTQTVDWAPTMTGQKGGLLGWAFGSLLMAGLGRIPALAALLLLGMVGVGMVMRYTPLVYIFPALSALFPALGALPRPHFSLDFLRRSASPSRPSLDERYEQMHTPLPDTPNFVKANQSLQIETEEEDLEPILSRGAAPADVRPAKKSQKSQHHPHHQARAQCGRTARHGPPGRGFGHLRQHGRQGNGPTDRDHPGRFQRARAGDQRGERPHGDPVWRGTPISGALRPAAQDPGQPDCQFGR